LRSPPRPRTRLPFAAIVPSVSIAIMEVIVAIAWLFAFAVNRAMIRRGKGHAVVHQYHEH
jgi:hypothetical protein